MKPFRLNPPPEFFQAPLWERQEFLKERLSEEEIVSLERPERLIDLVLGSFFEEAKLYRLYKGDYQGFLKEFWYSTSSKIQGWWYHRHGTDFRKPLHYQRKSHHQKKVLSSEQLARKEWRQKKGFGLDRKRSVYGQRKKVAKRISNRSYRAWVRNALAHENYDALSRKSSKDFFDPWFWD